MKKKIIAMCLCVALLTIAIAGASLAYFTDQTEKAVNTFTMGGVKIDLTEPSWDANVDHPLMPGSSFDKDPTITVKDGSADSYVYLEMSLNKFSSLLWVMAADASYDPDINFTIFQPKANEADKDQLLDAFKTTRDDGTTVFSTTKFLNAVQANKTVYQQIVNKWFGGITHEDWQVLSCKWGNENTDKNLLTIRLAYIGGDRDGILSAGESATFMKRFGMPASVTQEMIDAGADPDIGGMQNAFNTANKALELTFVAYGVQAEGFGSAEEAWNSTFGK